VGGGGMKLLKKSREKYIKTTDYFFPNYENNKVFVYLFCAYMETYSDWLSKISVSGADDYGLSIEGGREDYERFEKLYKEMPEPITIDWLVANGFTAD
jgi:hypothetical protein